MATATIAVVGGQGLIEHREAELQGLPPASEIPPIEQVAPEIADARMQLVAIVAALRYQKVKKRRGQFVGGEHFPIRVPGHGYFTRRGGEGGHVHR